jgi:hypothetical protein
MMDSVAVGFQFPRSAMDQFNAGQKWDVVPDDGGIDGGHYVPGLGVNADGDLVVVTWGREQAMSRAFYEKYCDQAAAILSLEALTGGKSVEGFDIPELQAALSNL